jgi:hypothetical protein
LRACSAARASGSVLAVILLQLKRISVNRPVRGDRPNQVDIWHVPKQLNQANLALNVEKEGISPNIGRPADKGRERADVANVVVARLLAEAAHINGILTKIRHWIPPSRVSFGEPESALVPTTH